VWVWRDDLGSGGAHGSGGWRLDAYGTWVWDEPSPLERPGAGTGALRERVLSAGGSGRARDERRTGDRALAALDHADPTPIFHELAVDRRERPRRETPRSGARSTERETQRETRRGARSVEPSWRDRDAVSVPEPHPGSGPLPIQDGGRGLADVPTVPPPAGPGSGVAESPEDELRRRAERRRRPLGAGGGRDDDREGGRHTWRSEETRTGRHALRR
jgi:hypothetical protein